MLKNKKIFLIGGAGFIGSHLVDKLIEQGNTITIYDNLTTGKKEFIDRHLTSWKANLIVNDVLKFDNLRLAMQDHDIVFHFSANSEARHGLTNTRLDLEQNTIATHNVLEAMRLNGIKQLVFASSGTVYGDTSKSCAETDLGNLPISLYGASKIAAEALISAYTECFDFTATILRFGNVIGPRATHGAIYDFCNKLKTHLQYLDVLGNGSQSKPYIYVDDVVEGILYAHQHGEGKLRIFNLAPHDAATVQYIAEHVVANSPYPDANIQYSSSKQGWRGDVAMSRLDASKLEKLGFQLHYTSRQAIDKAVKAITQEIFG